MRMPAVPLLLLLVIMSLGHAWVDNRMPSRSFRGHPKSSRNNVGLDVGKTPDNKNQRHMTSDSEERSQDLRKTLTSLGQVQDSTIRVGSTVVAGTSIPNLGIWQYQSYQVQSIYDQSTNRETGVVEKIPRETVYDDETTSTISSSDGSSTTTKRYVVLFSSKHNQDTGPVVVSPSEAQLSSMQKEVVDSVLWALPLFGFWTALAWSFASQYSQRTGGDATFMDAMLGR